MHRISFALVSAVLLLALTSSAAQAATFTPSTFGEGADAAPGNGICATTGGACTLRAAVMEANTLIGVHSVALSSGRYTTTTALGPVTKNVSITGAGAGLTTVDGPDNATTFSITGGEVSLAGFTVTGSGRAINVSGGTAVLDRMSITGNTLTAGGNASASGIYVKGASAKALVTRSAVVINSATSTGLDVEGAGIHVEAGRLEIESSTIAGNIATAGPGRVAVGAGIYAKQNGSVALKHVTVADNVGQENLRLDTGATGTVADSILTGPRPNCVSGGALPVASGRNIDSGTSCGFGAGHLSSTNPQLNALGDHGGPTPSMTPQLGGPAVGAALACPVDGIDQRGAAAPTGSGCDIGATELATDLGVTLEASRTDTPPGGDVTFIARVTNNGPDAATSAVLDLSPTGATQVVLVSPSLGTCTSAVRCELGTLARGASAVVTVVLRAGASGPLAPTALVSTLTPEQPGASNTAGASAAVTGAPSLGGSAPAAITPALTLGPLRLSGTARTRRAIRLTSTVSAGARVTLRVTRLVPGRRAGNACSRKARSGKRCTAAVTLGTVRATRTAGRITLIIPARLKGRSLPRGSYRITANAVDAAGRRSATRTLTFTVSR